MRSDETTKSTKKPKTLENPMSTDRRTPRTPFANAMRQL